MLVMLSGCAGLPDVARGKAALERGDIEAAKQDLEPLAKAGYVDAQTALGRVYARESGGQSLRKAIDYYRGAYADDPGLRCGLAKLLMQSPQRAEQLEAWALLELADDEDDPQALPLKIRFHRQHPGLIGESRVEVLIERARNRARPDDVEAVAAWLRDNSAQSEHRSELISLCEGAQHWMPKCLVDLAYHYRVTDQQEQLGRVITTALEPPRGRALDSELLVRVAKQLIDPQIQAKTYPSSAVRLLLAANSHNAQAQTMLALLLLEQPDLSPQHDPIALLQSAAEQGDNNAALKLGRLLMEGEHAEMEADRALALLRQAAQTDRRAHYELGEYFEKGLKQRPDPRAALEHYLVAARAGYSRADFALAEMYWRNRGVKRDLIKAYVFSRLAEHHKIPGSDALMAAVSRELSAAQFERAEAAAQREFDWRTHMLASVPEQADDHVLLQQLVQYSEVSK